MMFFLFVLLAARAWAQDADFERLKALLKDVPPLAVEKVELKPDPPVKFETISAVTADSRGNIYVLHRPANGDPLVVLDSRGKVLRSWGKGMYTQPHGLKIDPEGNAWTVDSITSMVYKFTPEGKKLLEISVGDVPGRLRICAASDIAFGNNGRVFVSDGYCNTRVIEYDASGKKVREWGKPGAGPGEFDLLHSIARGPDGNLYIADRENSRVQWFDQQGKFLGQWKYAAQLFTLAFAPTGEFYASFHRRDSDFGETWVVRIDLATGKMLGQIQVRAHQLSVAPDGTLLPGTINGELVLLRPRR